MIKAISGLSILAAGLYFGFSLLPSLPVLQPHHLPISSVTLNASSAKTIPLVTLNTPGGRALHQVRVIRSDSDGFVVLASEGTVKIWDRQVSSEDYAQLQRVAPSATATPAPAPNVFDQRPQASPKQSEKSSNPLKELLNLWK